MAASIQPCTTLKVLQIPSTKATHFKGCSSAEKATRIIVKNFQKISAMDPAICTQYILKNRN